MREWWLSGKRTAEIIHLLDQEGLPTVTHTSLARYGQRNWSDTIDKFADLDDTISYIKENVGDVKSVSVSRSGYSVSVNPRVVDPSHDKIIRLPKNQNTGARSTKSSKVPTTHIIIPDTQVAPGRPTVHLEWFVDYINTGQRDGWIDDTNVRLIHLGDHWDMPSLSSYDKGKGAMEGRRYLADIEAGNDAMSIFSNLDYFDSMDKHYLFGNHSNRIDRATASDPQLMGLLTKDHCLTPGWNRHEFQAPVELDGIFYSHYWYNPANGRPYGGMAESRLKQIGHSFVQGHKQGLMYANRYIGDRQQLGIVAGSFYLHEEGYMGPQGTGYWRGFIILRNVQDGYGDPEFVSMDQLCRFATGKPLGKVKY